MASAKSTLGTPGKSVSGKSAPKISGAKSNGKLGQTLTDLEAALNDWDALTDAPVAPAETTQTAPPTKDAELRKKTKMLLDQLREQLAELAE